jgi:hypothetical protein
VYLWIREEKQTHMKKELFAVYFMCFIFLFSCRSSEVKPLEGKWHITTPGVSAQEKYLPDEIEFFHDGTVTLSDLPDKKLPFKTNLTKEEWELIKKNYPDLKGKNVLLILLDSSQNDWLHYAAVYQFSVSDDELTLRPAMVDKPIKFGRVNSRGNR